MINAAGGVDALDPKQRGDQSVPRNKASRFDLSKKPMRRARPAGGGRGGRTDAQREAEQLQRSYESLMATMREGVSRPVQRWRARRRRSHMSWSMAP